MSCPARVIVVGSVNRDLVLDISAPPLAGETLLASTVARLPGGKGANQAVAAARVGAQVTLVACVGADADGAALLTAIDEHGVDVESVVRDEQTATGLAVVQVLPDGANFITVAPGANGQLTTRHVEGHLRNRARRGDVVVVSAEIAPAAVEAALRCAAALGCRPVINLAPYRRLDARLVKHCNPLVLSVYPVGSIRVV